MISIYMIITSLAAAALGKGSFECNFSEPNASPQCFGAVGQPLIFHLPNTIDKDIKLTKDNKSLILKVVKNQIQTLDEEYVNKHYNFTSGTLNLTNAMKRHSGNYVLEQHAPDGGLLKKVHVHLKIQAPVSKPAVSQMCLSSEEMKVSCSSEGDGVEFIWTLDSNLLIQTKDHSPSPTNWTLNMESLAGRTAKQDKPSVSNVTISLHGQLTGNLACNVRNTVSRDETVIHLNSCKATVFTVAVIAGAFTLLLLVASCFGVINHKKSRTTTVNEGNSEDEVSYTDVAVIRNMKKT